MVRPAGRDNREQHIYKTIGDRPRLFQWNISSLLSEQVAAIVEAQKEAFAEALDTTLATKADVVRLEGRVDSLSKDMQSMELRLTIKLGAFIAAAVGVLIAVLKPSL